MNHLTEATQLPASIRTTPKARASGIRLRSDAWGLPDRRKIFVYFALVVPLDILFVVVYGGCNWLTSLRQDRLHLYVDWELAVPFIPSMIYPYLSLNVLFILPLFMLGESRLKLLAKRIAVGTLLSGVIFILLPAELAFERPEQVPGYQLIFDVLYYLDQPHNLVPSLHLIYSFLIISSLMRVSGPRVRLIFAAWLCLINAAVLLVHQHHVADLLGGFLIGYICLRTIRAERGGAT